MANVSSQMDSMLPAVDDDTRSTEEYLKDTKPMDISSVPAFQRPMDASDNDPLVGEDDAGNPVYRTMLGNTYTVRRNPDQRTTRTKVQEDVLPSVKDWLQNPVAPSQDQAVQMGKAIAKSVYDLVSIPADLATGKRSASDVTMGEVFDTTGSMVLGSSLFDVPGGRDTLRLFGGKGAKDLDVGAFAQARELMKDGVQRINPNNPEQFYDLNKKVWSETGWYIDPSDNQWRFEIDDSKSKVTLNNLPITYKEIQNSGGEFKLSDVFQHDEIYKQYPHLKNITVRFYSPSTAKNTTEQRADVSGYMDSAGNLLAINTETNTVEGLRDTLLHEIQHSIQNYEGFTPGSNTGSIDPDVLSKGKDKVLNQIKNLSSDNLSIKVNNAQLLGEVSKLAPIEDFFPANLANNYSLLNYTTDEIRKDLLDKRTDYINAILNKHPNADDFIGSKTASKVLANIDKLRDNIFKQAAFELGLPKLATEFYMGAGGEIESRLVEFSQNMTDWQRKNAEPTGSLVLNEKSGNYERMEGFPLDRAKDLLEKEGRYNKPGFRGKEGVDPTARSRRAVPVENLGSSDIYLDIPRSDFKLQRDSSGKIIPPKKGKHRFPAVDKLKSLFKDEKDVLDVLNLERDDTFTFDGKEYKFLRINTHTVGKDELDRNQFILSPEEGSNYYSVVTVMAEDSLGRTNYIGLSKFLDDPEKYIGKNISDQTTSLFGRVKGKLGLSPSTSQNIKPTLKDFGYYVDNPSESWVKGKQEYAEKYAKEGGKAAKKLLSGSQTAFLGIDRDKPLYLDVDFVSQLKGANDEVIGPSNTKYIELKESVEKEGFKPDQKGNTILIGVNHKGQAFIMEGNNRVAIAKEYGVPNIKAEVKYFNGGEDAGGEFSPGNILKYASQAPRQFAEGGAVGNMNRQMELFAQGGLRDDGMNMDPVSGNDVPSGSLAEEVRDDIPAQLSEGEYVVPADVVRYYGVKFFEDIRNKAKKGLMQMEADGRIGGEPMMPEEISEEDVMALEQMLATGAANGGLMDKLAKAAKTNKMINERANAKGMRIGYQAGGLTQATYGDPNRVDQLIDKVMGAAQKNPQMMQELSKRGVQINRTTPQMQPQQMDQANPMPETRQGMAAGGVTGLPMAPYQQPMGITPGMSQAAGGVTGLPMAPYQQPMGITPGMSQDEIYKYITTPTAIDPMYNVPGGSYIGAGVPNLTEQQPTASPEYCAKMGMAYDAEKNMCVPKPIEAPSVNDDDPTNIAPDSEEFTYKEPEIDYFSMSEEDLKNLGAGKGEDFLSSKFGRGLSIAIGGPAGVALVGFGAAKQGQSIAELRSAALTAKARGMDDIADILDKRANKLVANSSGLVKGLDKLGLMSGKNYFANQVHFNMPKMGGPNEAFVDLEMLDNDRKAFRKILQASAPPGMTYNPTSQTYERDDDSPSAGEMLGGEKIETTSTGVDVYRPTETTVTRPQLRPSTPTPTPQPSNNNKDDDGPSHAEIIAEHEAMREEKAAQVAKSEGTSDRTDDEGKETYSSKVKRGGGFAKGGLMKRPKK